MTKSWQLYLGLRFLHKKVPLGVLLFPENALLEKAINHFLLGWLKRTENNGYWMKPRSKFSLTKNSHTFISMTNQTNPPVSPMANTPRNPAGWAQLSEAPGALCRQVGTQKPEYSPGTGLSTHNLSPKRITLSPLTLTHSIRATLQHVFMFWSAWGTIPSKPGPLKPILN